jgi:hypothetical protein
MRPRTQSGSPPPPAPLLDELAALDAIDALLDAVAPPAPVAAEELELAMAVELVTLGPVALVAPPAPVPEPLGPCALVAPCVAAPEPPPPCPPPP